MKSIKDEIRVELKRKQVPKPENYEQFVNELAVHVDIVRNMPEIKEPSTELAAVRTSVRKLAGQLNKLPEWQKTGWWPYGNREAVAAWTENAIQMGELLIAGSGETKADRIVVLVKHVAHLWEKHFGKKPGCGADSPFFNLFCTVFPDYPATHQTVRKALG